MKITKTRKTALKSHIKYDVLANFGEIWAQKPLNFIKIYLKSSKFDHFWSKIDQKCQNLTLLNFCWAIEEFSKIT